MSLVVETAGQQHPVVAIRRRATASAGHDTLLAGTPDERVVAAARVVAPKLPAFPA
ncbi:hypothetical protein [Haloplanus sp.]|uniref:hypothetical protein n=1 Tax=Haloplanus sp. TaxID=1961696 RepID=UPI002614E2BB|nr:hypothetical protein [Haloplanus sp.]